jgi:hypothetical protein
MVGSVVTYRDKKGVDHHALVTACDGRVGACDVNLAYVTGGPSLFPVLMELGVQPGDAPRSYRTVVPLGLAA